MSALLLLLLLLCAGRAAADYFLLQAFASSTCSGAPIASQASNFPEACSQTRTKVVCINSTYGTIFTYSDSSCSKVESQSIDSTPYAACTPSNGIFLGRGIRSQCVAGSYTKPTTGLVSAGLYDSSSCLQVPYFVVQYPVDVCIPLNDVQGGRVTCDKDAASFKTYSDATCAGTVIDSSQAKYGCDLGNRTVMDCFAAAAPVASSAARTAAIVGGAIGGTLAVAAAVGAGVYFWRLRGGGGAARGKEAVPLL